MGFMFYESYRDAAQALPEDAQGEFYRMLVEYAMAGTEPDCSGPMRLGFELARPSIDRSVARSRAGAAGGSSRSDAKRAAARANGTRGGRPANPSKNPSTTQQEPKQKPNQGEVRGVRGKDKDTGPTLDEVREYVAQKGYTFDPESFHAYYSSQGWRKANGQRVTDWRRCCVTWESKRKGAKNDGFKVYDSAGEMRTLWEAADA